MPRFRFLAGEWRGLPAAIKVGACVVVARRGGAAAGQQRVQQAEGGISGNSIRQGTAVGLMGACTQQPERGCCTPAPPSFLLDSEAAITPA